MGEHECTHDSEHAVATQQRGFVGMVRGDRSLQELKDDVEGRRRGLPRRMLVAMPANPTKDACKEELKRIKKLSERDLGLEYARLFGEHDSDASSASDDDGDDEDNLSPEDLLDRYCDTNTASARFRLAVSQIVRVAIVGEEVSRHQRQAVRSASKRMVKKVAAEVANRRQLYELLERLSLKERGTVVAAMEAEWQANGVPADAKLPEAVADVKDSGYRLEGESEEEDSDDGEASVRRKSKSSRKSGRTSKSDSDDDGGTSKADPLQRLDKVLWNAETAAAKEHGATGNSLSSKAKGEIGDEPAKMKLPVKVCKFFKSVIQNGSIDGLADGDDESVVKTIGMVRKWFEQQPGMHQVMFAKVVREVIKLRSTEAGAKQFPDKALVTEMIPTLSFAIVLVYEMFAGFTVRWMLAKHYPELGDETHKAIGDLLTPFEHKSGVAETNQKIGEILKRPQHRTCYKCHEHGHIANECPSADRGGSGEGSRSGNAAKCFNCGGQGHLARNCSSPAANPRKSNGGNAGKKQAKKNK